MPVQARQQRQRKRGSTFTSFAEYARGVAGGLIVSLPLLYTMEVWWAGFTARPERLLVYLAGTYALLFVYNRIVGIRRDASWVEVAIDSVEELGIGLVVSTVALWLLGRIGSDVALSEVIGKIVVEAATVAIGVSVGTAQLGATGNGDVGMSGDRPGGAADDESVRPIYARQLAFALCGATLFAANIAPTEEVPMIAFEIDALRLLGIVLSSLVLAAGILFYSDFRGSQMNVAVDTAFDIAQGTVATYAVAFAASAALLWFFGRFDGVSLHTVVAQTIVLAGPASLGASAGRLLLQ